MGMNGRKNCRVIGRIRDRPIKVVTNILTMGPGDSIMHREKVPRKARISHCPSCHVHLCCCSARNVSAGENEVCSAVIEDAGDWRLRSFDLILRRILWGTSSCIDRHGICTCPLVSFQDPKEGCIAPDGAQFGEKWLCSAGVNYG